MLHSDLEEVMMQELMSRRSPAGGKAGEGVRSTVAAAAAVSAVILLSGCVGGPQKVKADMLARYPVLAVTGVEVKIAAEKEKEEQMVVSLGRNVGSPAERRDKLGRIASFIAAFNPDAARRVRGSLQVLDRLITGERREAAGTGRATLGYGSTAETEPAEEDVEPGLYEYTIDRLNRGFSRRGYMPIQRERINEVMEEQKIALSGQTSEDAQVGRMVQADAVVHGTLTVRFISDDSFGGAMRRIFGRGGSPCELLFSGDITTVDRGYILYSNAVSLEQEQFSAEGIEEVVEHWFEELPAISPEL
jgi:hypothetical protein